MGTRHLLSVADLSRQEALGILARAQQMKAGNASSRLQGRCVALLFEKPSLRTRVSFEVAVRQLGGECIYLGGDEVGLGSREPAADIARVLSRYVDALVVRTFAHRTLEDLAASATIPVINALSDAEHPCQTMADLLTIQERRPLRGTRVAFIGDGNNVASSLALGCALVGADFTIASPSGYELPEPVVKRARGLAAREETQVRLVQDPREAARGADVVYTDVWTSMGQEAEAEARRSAFHGYQVNPALLALARQGALLMHAMPAHYGEEVPAGMLDHPQSVAYDQAENRLHAQKAVLDLLL